MTLEVKTSYHGFKLNRKEKINELNSLALIFEHEATGAEILAILPTHCCGQSGPARRLKRNRD